MNVLNFIQLLEELSQDHLNLSSDEVQRMRDRFGAKILQMGHLEDDGSLSIPLDAIVEAVQSLGNQTINEANANIKSEDMVAMSGSAETLVERVAEAQKRKLEQMIDRFQSEPDATKAHEQWK